MDKPVDVKAEEPFNGILTRSDLEQSIETQTWFSAEYEHYTPEKEALSILKKQVDKFSIKAFMGTWCEDSQREIPRLCKILSLVNFPVKNLEIIALDKNKKSRDQLEKGFKITHVPTFVFYKNNIEIGRFVESAVKSTATDLAKIVSGQPYKNKYE